MFDTIVSLVLGIVGYIFIITAFSAFFQDIKVPNILLFIIYVLITGSYWYWVLNSVFPPSDDKVKTVEKQDINNDLAETLKKLEKAGVIIINNNK